MYRHHQKTIVAIITDAYEQPITSSEGLLLPRDFTDFLGTGKTLLQQTFERFCTYLPAEQILIVTGIAYRELAMEQLPMIRKEQVIGVPVRKSQAAILAHLAFKLARQHPGTTLVVSPADHLVLQNHAFLHVCSHAVGVVNSKGGMVALGVQPTHANRSYSYIRRSAMDVDEGLFRAEQWVDYTHTEPCQCMQQDALYLWYTGIFMWQVSGLLSAIQRLVPSLFQCFEQASLSFDGPAEEAALLLAYTLSPATGFNMDDLCRLEQVYVIPASFGWSDIGTWHEHQHHQELIF